MKINRGWGGCNKVWFLVIGIYDVSQFKSCAKLCNQISLVYNLNIRLFQIFDMLQKPHHCKYDALNCCVLFWIQIVRFQSPSSPSKYARNLLSFGNIDDCNLGDSKVNYGDSEI